MAELLTVKNLCIEFGGKSGSTRVVDGISFGLEAGEILGIVGESGSGKTMTALAITGLLEKKNAKISGEAVFNGTDLLTLDRSHLRQYQGSEISMIFQEPMTSLDPTMRIGRQIEESLRLHTDMKAGQRRSRALELMRAVELPEPEKCYDRYPHELSGGMRQRVMIASALILSPKLLVADEPTTALDLTIQAQILKLLKKLNSETGTAMLFISHDLGVVRHLCSRVLVMEHGRIVEVGSVERVFNAPEHEYTKRLIASIPRRVKTDRRQNDGR